MRSRAGIVLQARMASTPAARQGARARSAGGRCSSTASAGWWRPAWRAWCWRRRRATKTTPSATSPRGLGVAVYRGSDTDVLGRMAEPPRRSISIRWSAPPATTRPWTSRRPGRVLAALRVSDADYVFEDGLPYGAAVEAVTARGAAPRRARGHATPTTAST